MVLSIYPPIHSSIYSIGQLASHPLTKEQFSNVLISDVCMFACLYVCMYSLYVVGLLSRPSTHPPIDCQSKHCSKLPEMLYASIQPSVRIYLSSYPINRPPISLLTYRPKSIPLPIYLCSAMKHLIKVQYNCFKALRFLNKLIIIVCFVKKAGTDQRNLSALCFVS